MKHFYLLLLFAGFTIQAQTYTWQWAKQGGGTQGSSSTTFDIIRDEMTRDIVVDNQNNSYFLTKVYSGNSNIGGPPIVNYGKPALSDLLLVSLDCNGNVRWTRTIGGFVDAEYSFKINIDNNGGLYMMAHLYSGVTTYGQNPDPSEYDPVYIDDNVALPLINAPYSNNPGPFGTVTDDGFKKAYLLKYNTSDGHIVWSKPLQGAVAFLDSRVDNSIWYMDSSKNIHAVIGFLKGSHLNGLINVPNTYYGELTDLPNGFQYYLVKFNYDNGNMTPDPNPVLLPITKSLEFNLLFGNISLLYDETLQRYYLAGSTSGGFMDYAPISYNGIPFSNDAFILSFDPAGNELWRREFTTYTSNQTTPLTNPYEKIFALVKDAAGSIYLSGRYYNGGSNDNAPAPTLNGSSAGGGTYSYTLPYGIYGGEMNFVMKLNPAGEVQWTKIPTSTQFAFAGTNSSRARIALNGNEIAFTKGSRGQENWDSFPINNPTNDLKNSLLVRLNKDTGSTIAVHPVSNGYGSDDELTSVAVDNDGNYILGGYFSTTLFNDPNDNIPTMTTPSYESDFYVAKLAKSACSTVATAETSAPEAEILFYPNPVNDMLKIETREKLDSYEVMTADGRMVSTGRFKGTDYSINMQQLTPGTYFIRVKGENISRTSKVIKK